MPATDSVKKPIAVNATKTGGSFHPFKKEKAASAIPTSSTSNDNLNGGGQSSGSHIEEKVKEKTDGSSYRKESRCWSPELHKRFLNIAFQDLCGSQIATPKQIRELLKVGGLTNDEVKSHLQKYCLHNRKPTNSTVEASLNDPHQPDILLLSGKFVPPSNCTGSATTANADTKIYAPVASLPSQAKQQQQTILKYNTSPTSPLVSMVLFQNRYANGGYGCKVTNSGSSGIEVQLSLIEMLRRYHIQKILV